MPSQQQAAKEAYERDVFLEFAAMAGLPLVTGSVANGGQGEPDILCDLENDGRVAFELVRIIDSGLAELISIGKTEAIATADPTADEVAKKVRKIYQTPYPVELVVYCETGFIFPRNTWEPLFADQLTAMRRASNFRRLWVANMGGRPQEYGIWFVDPPMPSPG